MRTIPTQTIPIHPIPPSGSLNPCCPKGKRGLLAKETKNARCHLHAGARTYGGVTVINSTNCPSPGPGEATPRLDRLMPMRVETAKRDCIGQTQHLVEAVRNAEQYQEVDVMRFNLMAWPRCRGYFLGFDDESVSDGGVAMVERHLSVSTIAQPWEELI